MADSYEAEESDEPKPKRGRPSSKAKLQEFHQEARAEFARIQSVMREERTRCLQDRRFVHVTGAQWEGKLGDQFANRPMYEINKVALAIEQITTDYKENRIDATFVSKHGVFDKALAEACAARYRADMQDSNAQRVFGVAFEEGVAGGVGAWRLKTCYEDKYSDDEDDPQRIMVEAIPDADRFVFFDLDSREPDKSDARRCYVLCPMTHSEYERRYPDRGDISSWPDEVHQGEFDWATDDTVYVAEVYDVEWEKDVEVTFHPPAAGAGDESAAQDIKPSQLKMLWKSDIDADQYLERDLLAMGYSRASEKKRKRKAIYKYLMDGMGVIEKPVRIVGCEIPVVMFFAKQFFIDNVERCRGHVRLARDAQQIKNMLVSKLAEFVGVSSPEKPLFTPEQMQGLGEIWANDNLENNPWLPVNPVTNADGQKQPMGPVGYTKNPSVPPTLGALHQAVDVDMKEILSTPADPAGKVVSHTSGKVVNAAKRQVDAKSAQYISNLADAIRWSARIWLGMAPEVYNQEGRKLRGVGPRGEESVIELMQPSLDEDGDLETLNDFSRAKFDVSIEIGPSSESEAEAAVDTGISMLGVVEDPQTKNIVALSIIMNSRGTGSKGLQKWARKKLVEMGVEDPTPDEAKAIEAAKGQQQPTPIDQLALAQAKEAEAKAANADANRAYTLARVEKTQADTVKVLADVGLDRQSAQIDAAKTVHDMAVEKASMESTPGQSGPAGPLGSS